MHVFASVRLHIYLHTHKQQQHHTHSHTHTESHAQFIQNYHDKEYRDYVTDRRCSVAALLSIAR